MKVTIEAEPKEIAELICEIQARQDLPSTITICDGDEVVCKTSLKEE